MKSLPAGAGCLPVLIISTDPPSCTGKRLPALEPVIEQGVSSPTRSTATGRLDMSDTQSDRRPVTSGRDRSGSVAQSMYALVRLELGPEAATSGVSRLERRWRASNRAAYPRSAPGGHAIQPIREDVSASAWLVSQRKGAEAHRRGPMKFQAQAGIELDR